MDIRIEGLKKSYGGRTVLDVPQLQIAGGEIIGLVGNNGAGKTTLLRLMLDLIRADEGRVSSGGAKNVAEDDRWKTYTGSYLDDQFLVDFYTPEEYFAMIARLYGFSDAEMEARLQAYAPIMRGEVLGTHKYLRQLSAGNRQKTGIVGAMLIRPQVLILDEPFNFLDPSSQMAVAQRIVELNKEAGTTVVLSSHNLNNVSDISTRILLLEHGVIKKDLLNTQGVAIDELNAYFQSDGRLE